MAIAEPSGGPEKNPQSAKPHKKHKIHKGCFQNVAHLRSHCSCSWRKKKKKDVFNRQLEVKLMACQVVHLGELYQPRSPR